MVSWSVTDITDTPARAARSTSSRGVQRPSEAVVCRWRSIDACGANVHRAARAEAAPARFVTPCMALTLHQRLVLAHQQIQMFPLFVGELEEDLFALGVFEAVSVFLEEPVRTALAADANQQRLLVVDPFQEAFGAFGEQSVRSALEE